MNQNKLDPEIWMQQMADKIHTEPIKNIAMAGIHHPASYSFMCGDLAKYLTAEHNIYQQLMNGVRYFDSRPKVHIDSEKEQIVEYHGDSYGASYNTLLRSFSDFFKGYNTLSAYGESPNIIPLSDNEFVMLYHSERLYGINKKEKEKEKEEKEKNVFSTELFYRKATYDPNNKQLNWGDEQAYNYGITPDAVITNSGKVIEVHKSQNADKLWYTLGEVYSGIPTFNLRFQENYTTGVQPTISLFPDETILEVHKTENADKNNQLWFSHFELNDEGNKLNTLEHSYIPGCKGTNPKLLSLPDQNKILLFYSNNDKELVCVVATFEEGIKFSKEIWNYPTNDLDTEPNISVCLTDGGSNIALSYTKANEDISVRSYVYISISDDFKLVSTTTEFNQDYPTWNINSAALFYTGDNKLISLEADIDALHNIWYQPLTIGQNDFELAKIDSNASAKKGEFVVMSLSHSGLNQLQVEKLNRLIEHFLSDKVVKNDGSFKMETTSLENLLLNEKQMVIYINDVKPRIDIDKLTVFWPEKNNFSSPWHDLVQGHLCEKYYKKIFDFILKRSNNEYKNQVYVLQTHLTSNSSYNSVLDWNKEYTPISNSYLLSLQKLLIKHNVNIIENDRPTPFLFKFCCELNDAKYQNRKKNL